MATHYKLPFNESTMTMRVLLTAGADDFAKRYYKSALDAVIAGKCLIPTKYQRDLPNRFDSTLAILQDALKSKQLVSGRE